MNDGAALFAEGSPWLLCESRLEGGPTVEARTPGREKSQETS